MNYVVIIILIIIAIIILIWYYNTNNIFYSSNQYPQFKLLEENWKIICDEIPVFDSNKVTLKRNKNIWNNEKMNDFAKLLADNPQWFKSWDNTNVWYSFPLMYHNKIVGKVNDICPNTSRLLKSLKNVRIAGFSLLTPNGILEKHQDNTGPNYNSMALNMNLTGDKCSLLIKPDNSNKYHEYFHKKGKAVIFNAEPWHYAKNYDNKNRVILYVDFWTN